MRRLSILTLLLYMSYRVRSATSYQDYVGSEDDSYSGSVDCGDDDGDCCGCNATSISSTSSGYTSYNCSADTPCACDVPPPCSNDPELVWEVEDDASAMVLAGAVRCSGGVFNIQWRGNHVLEGTICVTHGTFLNITGAGEEAGVQGSGNSRIFTVVDASLSVHNMSISDGFAMNGGAVFAARSNLSFSGTSFIDNRAVVDGGALHAVDGSSVSWSGDTVMSGNAVHDNGHGGAVFMNGSSRATCSGSTEFSNNTSHGSYDHEADGGAVYVGVGCSFSSFGFTRFGNNHAAQKGGAVYVGHDAQLLLSGNTTFDHNYADHRGGAVCIEGDSAESSFSGSTSFSDNDVGHTGGALFVSGGAVVVSFDGTSIFSHNRADHSGGAVYVLFGSAKLSFSGSTVFESNSCALNGGAIYAHGEEELRFWGRTGFDLNSAHYNGGAVYVATGVSLSFTSETSFRRNRAESYHGGAVFVDSSNASWSGVASFSNNSAGDNGGALKLGEGANVSWEAEAEFLSNSARSRGGAVYLEEASSACWNSTTTFTDNTARFDGGALGLIGSSTVKMGAGNVSDYQGGAQSASQDVTVTFSRNSASTNGGAVFLRDNSDATWTARVIFVKNVAESSGGAVYVSSGAGMSLDSEASFIGNTASGYGGGLYVAEGKASIAGETIFRGNVCQGSGGGMVILSDSTLTIGSENTTFIDNSALVSGGAIYISGVDMGQHLVDFKFISNSAQIGGALYITGSGTFIGESVQDIDLVEYPTVIDRCTFIGNTATASGGAVASGGGRDVINNTYFEANSAMAGGALRLAGTAAVHNCTFLDNTSDEGQGPAIANVGVISAASRLTFFNNLFVCKPGTFLAFEEPETSLNLFAVVCEGCTTECQNCDASGDIPWCMDHFEHTTSPGGNTTVETLTIDQGYWRATNTSPEVLACYNQEACLGGVTREEGNCLAGYEGPYCAICSEGYTEGLAFSCEECSDSSAGIAITVIAGFVIAVLSVGTFIFMLSGEDHKPTSGRRGVVFSWMRKLHSLKIIIIVWQILTQFASVANIVYPDVYQRFLDGVDVISLNFNWIPSTDCILGLGFHDRLIVATTFPIVCLAILGATFAFARTINARSDETLQRIRRKHFSMVLLLTFLVYSPVSSILFQMFACDDLDDGKVYLRADYRIECDSSKHRALQAYAGVMMLLYTVGIPAFYATVLYFNRKVLSDGEAREEDKVAKSISNLWDLYRPNCMYFELVECARRVLLAGIVVFIYPNTAAQVAVALMMGGFFMLVSEAAAPYASHLDTWISRAGHAIICTSMYLALLLKVDVTSERNGSQKVFESILVTAHVCMVLAVITEAFVVTCGSLRETQLEEKMPRFRGIMGMAIFPLEEGRGDEGKESDKSQEYYQQGKGDDGIIDGKMQTLTDNECEEFPYASNTSVDPALV